MRAQLLEGEDEEDPWFSWLGLGNRERGVDAFVSFEHNAYLDVTTVYAGLAWGSQQQGRQQGGHVHRMDVETMRLRPAGRGGLVAVTHDEDKVSLMLTHEDTSSRQVRLCTLSGRLIREIDFVSSALGSNVTLFDVGWVGDDCLVLASPFGLVHAHHVAHGSYTLLSMGESCEHDGLAEMRASPDGIFFRTKANRFGVLRVDRSHRDSSGQLDPSVDVDKDKTHFLGPIDLEVDFNKAGRGTKGTTSNKAAVVHCFEVLPCLDSAIQLVVAINADLVFVDRQGGCRMHTLKLDMPIAGPFIRMCISPNSQCIAAMAATSNCLCVFDMSGAIRTCVNLKTHGVSSMDLRCLGWCGSEAVVASFEGREELLVALLSDDIAHDHDNEDEDEDDNEDNKGGNAHRHEITWVHVGNVHAMSSEVDGVFLLGKDQVQLCRLVPEAVRRVLGPGSTSPGALLLDSRNLMGHEDVRAAAELLEVIQQDSMEQAVTECLQSAEWCTMHPSYQERLLRACVYGRVFSCSGEIQCDVGGIWQTEVDVAFLARSMRILNALVEPDVGMPLTLAQYGVVGLRGVIDRLCCTGHFSLALSIAEWMKPDRAGNHERLAERVLLAWAKRKISAATTSIDDTELLHELRTSINRSSPNDPVSKMIDKKHYKISPAVSWSTIAEHALDCGRPQLAAMLIEMEPSLKKQVSILLRLGRTEMAMKKARADGDGDSIWAVVCGCRTTGGDPAELMREHYASLASRSSPSSSILMTSDDDKFLTSARAASERLMILQRKVEKSTNRQGFVGLSVIETLRRCYKFGLTAEAARIVKEFKVGDRQAAMVEMLSLADRQDWVAIKRQTTKLQSTGLILGAQRPILSPLDIFQLLKTSGASEGDLKQLKECLSNWHLGDV